MVAFPMRRALVLLLVGALGCGSSLTLPNQPTGGENVALMKIDGDSQIGTVGEALQKPLMVQVLTDRQEPAVNRKIVFQPSDPAGGQVTPDTAITNDAGVAIAQWVLGTAPGSHAVLARLVDVEGQLQEFRAEARAAAPDTLSPVTPLAQPGRREQAVNTPPAVRVVDRFGNPVAGIPVAWQVTAGQGRVSEPISTTDAEGNATVTWTLGNRIGVHKLTAAIGSVTGSPVTFTAHVFF